MYPPDPVLDVQKLAGLVFELSSQLHEERVHRLALEAALVRAGVLDPAGPAALAADPALRESSRRSADDAVARLLRVLVEGSDARTPLRERVLKHGTGA